MRAVCLESPGEVFVRTVDEPATTAGALVKVRTAGVCGTDLKIVSGAIPVAAGRILGHEIIGTVVSGGPASAPAGTRVLVDPSLTCERCAVCRRDHQHLCPNGGLLGRDVDGGFADFVAVPPSLLHPVPDSISDSEAALLQVLGTCVHAQQRVRVFPGDAAVVLGLGVSGLLHVQLLQARGANPIIAATRSPWKRELARSLGATDAVSPEDLGEAVARLPAGGADLVVECVGKADVARLAMSCAGMGGSVLLFGTISPEMEAVPTYRLYHREVDVINSRAARARDYETAIALASVGSVRLGELVTGRFPLSDARVALQHCTGADQLKVLLDVAGTD